MIHYHLPRTVKKRTLDPRALLGVLIRHFPIALYSSFFILKRLWFFDSNSQNILSVISSLKNNVPLFMAVCPRKIQNLQAPPLPVSPLKSSNFICHGMSELSVFFHVKHMATNTYLQDIK